MTFVRYIFFLLFFIPIAAVSTPNNEMGKFISIADIHFDPFLNCKASPCPLARKLIKEPPSAWNKLFEQEDNSTISTFGEDTNYVLFRSTLNTFKEITNNEYPQFGIVIGDLLPHQFREKYIKYTGDRSQAGFNHFAQKTIQYIVEQIRHELPNIDIYAAVGNNDSYTGNYTSVPHGKFFQDTAKSFARLINNNGNKKSLLKDFPAGGYYAITLSPSQKIIILNSVLFSVKAKNPAVTTAAQKELNWLHLQLLQAKKDNQQILLVFHIPLGIDVYATLKEKLSKIIPFWHAEFSHKFEQELTEFSSVITGILPAHIHMDAFQLVATDSTIANIPVSFTPAISPIYGNNPAFKIYQYDSESFELKNFETYYYPLSLRPDKWQKEYSFNQVYQPHCDYCNLEHGMTLLKKDNQLAYQYKKYYVVDSPKRSILDSWDPYYWCSIKLTNVGGYEACLKG